MFRPLLQALDRCDRCGAQAFVAVMVTGVELLFCGHHYHQHELALLPVTTQVNDQRDRINQKPSISAAPLD